MQWARRCSPQRSPSGMVFRCWRCARGRCLAQDEQLGSAFSCETQRVDRVSQKRLRRRRYHAKLSRPVNVSDGLSREGSKQLDARVCSCGLAALETVALGFVEDCGLKAFVGPGRTSPISNTQACSLRETSRKAKNQGQTRALRA